MEQGLDDVLRMSQHARRRRQSRPKRAQAWRRRAAAVLAVAGKADLGVDLLSLAHHRLFVGREGTRHEPVEAARVARVHLGVQHGVSHELNAFGLVAVQRRLHDRLAIGYLHGVDREQRLDHDVSVGAFGHRRVVGSQRLLAGLVQRLADAQRLDADLRIGVLHQSANQRRIGRAEAFEGPHGVDAGELVVSRLRHRLQRGDHRRVLLQDQQLLRGVAPPAVGILQVFGQLRRRLVQHFRLLRAPAQAFIGEAPDAPVLDDLVEAVLFDAFAQIRAGSRPLRFLHDPAIHIGDVHRAVGGRLDVDWTEQRIGRPDELRQRIRVLHLRQPVGLDRTEATDDTRNDLAIEIIADQILRQPVATVDGVARGAGRPRQRAVGHAHGIHPALHVRDEHRRAPGDRQVRLELVGVGVVAVVHGKLEVAGHPAGPGLEHHLAVVVLRDAPLAAVRAGRLTQDAVRRPPDPHRVDGAVDPIVHAPDEAGFLVLDVEQAAEPGGEELFLVRDAVAVGVGVFPNLVGVRFLGENRVLAERCHEAGEHELVDEDVVRFVDAVAVLVLVHRDAADRIQLAGRVGVLHVAANLEDEHPAVAVEGDLRRLEDVGFGEDRFELESRRQPQPLRLVSRREHRDRPFLGEVRLPHRRAAAWEARRARSLCRRSARARRLPWGRGLGPRLSGGRRRLRLGHDRQRQPQDAAQNNDSAARSRGKHS